MLIRKPSVVIFASNFVIDLEEIVCCSKVWGFEAQVQFVSHNQYSRGRVLLRGIVVWKTFTIGE